MDVLVLAINASDDDDGNETCDFNEDALPLAWASHLFVIVLFLECLCLLLLLLPAAVVVVVVAEVLVLLLTLKRLARFWWC